MTTEDDTKRKAVRRRQVFYVPGFDPRGPVFYHDLYRQESAKQAGLNGLAITTGKRRNIDMAESCWTLETSTTQTSYHFLRYEDIIRQHWPGTALAMTGSVLRYSWRFARMGVHAALLRNSWPTLIAVLYAPLVLLGGFLAGAAIWAIAALVLQLLIGAAAWIVMLPLIALPLLFYTPLDKRYNAFWLARSCAFLVARSRGEVAGIEDRCRAFASRIAVAAADPGIDEVLLVGHSVGTHLAVTIAARAIEDMPDGAKLRFLTLGQAIAMTPDEPAASQFRIDLLAIATSPKIIWIDVTSAIDSSCIPLTDPLAASGVARPPGAAIQPKLVSARFNAMFSTATAALMRRDRLRTHFQYLMASERAGDYDYFLITAGDRTLEDRFAHLESVTGFNRFRIGRP